ncbi:MAG: SDR family oxidoreductase [Saprospiraceae bacterium]|jgi:short-subunit dehydrogenase
MKAVLITGTSSGIGKSIALHIDMLGYKVYAGVRKHTDGEELKKQSTSNLRPVIIDVADEKSIISAKELIELEIQNYSSFALVNNAGVAIGSPVETKPNSLLRFEMEVNYFGVIAVIQKFLPVLRQKQGKIINISSISGRSSMPFNGTYCASKFALEAITDALRLELKPWNISVSNILPGDIKTEIWEKAITDIDKRAAEWKPEAIKLYGPTIEFMKDTIRKVKGSNPDIISKAVEKLLISGNPKTRVYIGENVWFYYFLEKLPTKLRDWLILSKLPNYGITS